MTTISPSCPCPASASWARALKNKRLWITLNRGLAWILLISPVIQIALGTRLVPGLLLDLALLVAHAALSLALFGLPQARHRDGWVRWLGFAPAKLTERGSFLMTGWRIALAMLTTVLWPTGMPIVLLPLTWPAWLLWLRLPFSIASHVYRASGYALRRWGADRKLDVQAVAVLITVACFAANFINLLR